MDLSRDRDVCNIMTRIIIREGVKRRVSRFLFIAMVQAVLLFGTETWVATPRTGRVLGWLQYHVARQMKGKLPQRKNEINWD